ncbi:MAG: HlyD family efflux transporter periplasmic adaptor subunit [Lachnospiraceae bacterium]
MKINAKKMMKIAVPCVVGIGIVGGILALNLNKANAAMSEAMSVTGIKVETGDVAETVETSGTVISGQQKVFFSPVNAMIGEVNFKVGDLVKSGDTLVTFNLTDLEKQNQKAELTAKAGELGYQDTLNKSKDAAQKQEDAKAQVSDLQGQVDNKKQEIANLSARIFGDAKAQAAAQEQEIINMNQQMASLQQQAEELKAAVIEAKKEYDKAVLEQQAAQVNFDTATAVASQNPQGVTVASESLKSANSTLNFAKSDYEGKKTELDTLRGQLNGLQSSVNPTTSASNEGNSQLQQKITIAQGELAELQGQLESKKAIAQADSATLSKEAKAQMQTNNNLAELEGKSLEELIAEGKKGITAEFNGVVSESQVMAGGAVTQGGQLITVQSIEDVNVEVKLSKNVYENVKEGQKAKITFAGQTYEGSVSHISRIATSGESGSNQAATSTAIRATVHIDQPDDNIFLGVEAKVSIQAAQAKDVVILPTEAVNIGKDGTFCWVAQDGIMTKRKITLGVSSDEVMEITEGLKAGEIVITDPGIHEEGDSVQVSTADTGKENQKNP